ncbi:MAG: EVE domain-containing protein [Ignavibacteria bacterium]|nr:EVE domain-containing protein [Ignavibacteria bacterium]
MKNYWLFKSEPDVYSIDDLERDGTTFWDGVRNYEARNYLRDKVKKGDKVLFYHSNCEVPGVYGVCEVVKEGYPDFTQFDPKNKYYDPKSNPNNPTWFMVDVKFVKKLKKPVTLEEIKNNPKLKNIRLVQKGNRLSIIPLTKEEFDEILKMS